MTQLQELTEKAKTIMTMYGEEFPEVQVDRDYYPFKISEEWGECMQAYLMYTDRGRQKGKTKEEIRELLKLKLAMSSASFYCSQNVKESILSRPLKINGLNDYHNK